MLQDGGSTPPTSTEEKPAARRAFQLKHVGGVDTRARAEGGRRAGCAPPARGGGPKGARRTRATVGRLPPPPSKKSPPQGGLFNFNTWGESNRGAGLETRQRRKDSARGFRHARKRIRQSILHGTPSEARYAPRGSEAARSESTGWRRCAGRHSTPLAWNTGPPTSIEEKPAARRAFLFSPYSPNGSFSREDRRVGGLRECTRWTRRIGRSTHRSLCNRKTLAVQ